MAPGLLSSFVPAASFPSSLLYSKDKKPRSFAAAPVYTALSRRVIALLLISVLCLVVGLGGIAFTAANLRRAPRTITVFRCGRAEDSLRTYRSKSLAGEDLTARPKILGFVGVQTGFSSRDRRGALRSTWFPANPEGLMRSPCYTPGQGPFPSSHLYWLHEEGSNNH